MKNNMKYSIPAVGAIAVSMTACLETTSAESGEWEAQEFNGEEVSSAYNEYYGEKTYLDLTMSLNSTDSGGGIATATWILEDDDGAETTSLNGDYIIEDGTYDIFLDKSSGSPAELNLICTLVEDELDCTSGTIKSSADTDCSDPSAQCELKPSLFYKLSNKTE